MGGRDNLVVISSYDPDLSAFRQGRLFVRRSLASWHPGILVLYDNSYPGPIPKAVGGVEETANCCCGCCCC